jgi:uncharacterized protein (TIGR00730 family)
LLAARGLGLVYGGGNVGLMGILADAMLAANAEVVGVIPQSLVEKEVAHRGITRLHIVRTMHERKAMMNDFSDAFVALPGGFGTFEEFFEVLTWSQLGYHRKPCGVLNVLRSPAGDDGPRGGGRLPAPRASGARHRRARGNTPARPPRGVHARNRG